MNIKIIVAAHKPYFMPDDPAYFPLQAGADINPPLAWQGDNSGENISAKNRNFCELTCLYWAWKNLDADYLGLVHYRRHFSGKSAFDPKKRIITSQKLEKLFSDCDIIMPKKRNYFIESNFQQYIHAHHPEDLEVTEAVITEKYPDYLPAYNAVMKRSSGYRFNMCIMRRELLNDYCKWLFDILFEVEKRLDISNYSAYDARVFGFISERLLDIWIEKNNFKVTALPLVNLESQHWGKKICNFLLRKISGGKWGRTH
ncbi:MAG: DUF4422 domain-containing protein [Lentisphaerae bacterium]|nr:DUF4422 domain-containing protein [Lentisphaerota bacterium]